MYDNKYTNLVTAGNFHFPFSYSASLFSSFVFLVIPAQREKKKYYIVIKIWKKEYTNHIQLINQILEFVKLLQVCIIIKKYSGHKYSHCLPTKK